MKKDIVLRLHISLSKIFAFMIVIMGFFLTNKTGDSEIFLVTVLFGSAGVGIKQYFDRNKLLNNESETSKND